jgi:hypothetical protein
MASWKSCSSISLKRDDGAVVLLHAVLYRQVVVAVDKAEIGRQGSLVIEQKSILAPTGEAVEGEAYSPQKGLSLDQGKVLAFCQKSMGDQVVDVVGGKMALGDPPDHLDVPQATGILLDVRLQVIGRVSVLVPASPLLLSFGGEEIGAGPDAIRSCGRDHALEKALVAREVPSLEQVGHDGDVGAALVDAIFHRAHAVPDLESDVPEEDYQRLDSVFEGCLVKALDQHQDVDI